ncbi:MAG: hypothetical protein LBB73_04375, partial [Dysgonamonadaceae bacterium]|nr:hypothetical protein [Dysgonamonadaceae bacterium]
GNANILANGCRETVNGTGTVYVQRFNRFPGMEEEFCQQLSCPVHPAIETAFTRHLWHQSGRTDEAEGGFHIATKIHGSRKYNCNEFCISCFTLYRLFMLHRLQNIVKKMRILQRFL